MQTLSMLTASIITNINWNVVFRRGKISGSFLAVALLSYTLLRMIYFSSVTSFTELNTIAPHCGRKHRHTCIVNETAIRN